MISILSQPSYSHIWKELNAEPFKLSKDVSCSGLVSVQLAIESEPKDYWMVLSSNGGKDSESKASKRFSLFKKKKRYV